MAKLTLVVEDREYTAEYDDVPVGLMMDCLSIDGKLRDAGVVLQAGNEMNISKFKEAGITTDDMNSLIYKLSRFAHDLFVGKEDDKVPKSAFENIGTIRLLSLFAQLNGYTYLELNGLPKNPTGAQAPAS
jgi:hypothetical protein